jgi:hypothetical protein
MSSMRVGQRYRAKDAMLLVTPSGQTEGGSLDYNALADAVGVSGAEPDAITDRRDVAGVELRLTWVNEQPQT